MKGILLYLWQLPQNLLGLLLLLFVKTEKTTLYGIKYYYTKDFGGGISLGQYIILHSTKEKSIKHEYGHCIQSRILGPLYLIVIGLPSIMHAWLCRCKNHSYYDFYPEKWADKLAGIKRQ